MSVPSAKRKRADASITRSELWNDDGNVVLQAENIQFRVHWGILARNSSVFRDMQGLPQPPDEPNIDGCPVVELSDDPRDVEYLLKVLYTPTFLSQTVIPLAAVGALIRLGRKYDFKDLFDSAVARITSQYPTTFQEYDAMQGTTGTIKFYPGFHFDVVTLASENNILSALPTAYYRLMVVFTLGQLVHGIPRDDGTLASLSQVDLGRCVIARERLFIKQFQPGYTFGWARTWEFDGCATPPRCRALQEAVVTTHLDQAWVGALFAPGNKERLWNLCATCTEHVKESMTVGRRKIWDELPGIFELPPWSELKNDM
ncbi:hypothetical protein K438DRAFT_1658313 [Mycena galopus ATCC 62051]|nr:hypothetical protein K438DRAFT_1658313 [Mycena galopus ATCC 62051]